MITVETLLSPLITQSFPFYFFVDDQLIVRSHGRSLGIVAGGEVLNEDVRKFLSWESGELDLPSIQSSLQTLSVLKCRNKGVTLRGQFFLERGWYVFLGSPWLQDPGELEQLGLKISDFAPCDPVIDLMHVAQTQKMAVEELKGVATTLQRQRTELREINLRLEQREAEARKLALVASRTDNSVVITDAKGRIEWVNEGFTRLTGFSLEEVLGKKPGALLQGPDTDPAVVEEIRQKLKGTEGFDVEIINYSKSGRRYWVAIESRPITSEDGGLEGFMAIQRDITLRKETDERIANNARRLQAANEDLSTQKARLDALIQNLDGGVLVEDNNGRLALVNRNFCEIFGVPMEMFESGALIGLECAPLAAQAAMLFENSEQFLAEIHRLVEARRPVSGQIYELKDGRFLQRDFVPISLEGTAYGFLWHYRDVTRERRNLRVLEALARMSEVLLRGRLEESAWAEVLGTLASAIGAEGAAVLRFCSAGDPATETISSWGTGEETADSNDWISNDWLRTLAQGDVVAEEGWYSPRSKPRGGKSESLIIVPISVKGECWGCLHFSRRSGSFLIKRSAMALLRSAAMEVGMRLALQQDEDALKNARRVANEAAQAADAANQAKSTFLAAMSHEIRTPLNAVVGMSSLLLESSLTDQQAEYARTVVNASETLLELINDILDYSKIESGHVELDIAPFDFRETLLEPLEILTHAAGDKGLELSYFVDPALPAHFLGDRVRFKQVLLNLLANAVKFTEEGEIALEVLLVSREENQWTIRFKVRDTGIGIPPEAQSRLFKPFSQADASITRTYGGTGLGLAISRRLVELMGGEIGVKSAPGEGSEFSFELTLPEPPEVDAASVPAVTSLQGCRILVVDDIATNRLLLSEVSRHWGIQASLAASPAEALTILEKEPPFDLAILDFNMPGMDGIRLAEKIRATPSTASLPMVLFGSNMHEDRLEKKHLFRAMLMKPLRLAAFRQTLTEILRPNVPAGDIAGAAAVDRSELAGLSILVAEDNRNNQLMLKLMLGKFGCKPVFVDNGHEAVMAIEASHFDVAILDIQMPVMDGLTAASEIRELHLGRQKPFLVALTANAFQEDREACLKAGFDLYLSKPITAKRLGEMLTRVVQQRSSYPR